ncbi:hypothetical protein V8E52_010510 [Russula decolorans]
MGNCCGGTATVPSEPQPGPPVTQPRPSAPAPLQPNIKEGSSVPSSSRPPSRPRSHSSASKHESTQHTGRSSQDPIPRSRTKSAPQAPQISKSSSPQEPRARARSVVQPKRSSRSDSRTTGPEHAKGVRSPTMSYPSRRTLNSTVKQVLTENPQFRILVVGKRGSGKSSLINANFGVNMSAAPGLGSDINLAFRPDDNHHLIVHEYSGLEPGDGQGLRTIRDFITLRTDPNRAPAEKLHAIWICIPTSDAIDGSIGEGVDEILNMRRGELAPVVVAFTKSDLAFPHISGSESGHHQYQDRTRTRAYAQCEQLCRSLFRREARDVPAELVSVMPQYSALINNLIVTSDRIIMGSRTAPSSRSSSQGAKPRIAPAPLAWSVALRASRDITIQASIEIGRSRYWRSLWSSLDFADQPLKSCVNIIHVDIVEIWNLYDRNRYLSSNQFKINISHIVKDLAIPAGGATSSQENVRCVMGYIVNLTVILDDIFRTTGGNVTENAALKVMGTHVRSGRRDSIHRDIRSFVTETFSIRFAVPQKDLVLEKIIDLIRQYCAPPNRSCDVAEKGSIAVTWLWKNPSWHLLHALALPWLGSITSHNAPEIIIPTHLGQIALQVCHNAIISSRVSYEKDPHGATTDSCSEPQPPELEDGEELGQASEVA